MKLDQFLKWQGIASTGGEAKLLINSGLVTVNGLVENRRGKKLNSGDVVCFRNNEFIVNQTDPVKP